MANSFSLNRFITRERLPGGRPGQGRGVPPCGINSHGELKSHLPAFGGDGFSACELYAKRACPLRREAGGKTIARVKRLSPYSGPIVGY
jgi:hypothetical protein